MSELRTSVLPRPWDQAQVQGGGQLLGTARRPLTWESLKGPRTSSPPHLMFPVGCSMRGLLLLSVLLGAVLGKEDFAG